MLDPRTLEDMARRFVDGLPSGVRQLHSDLEKNAQVALQGALARLDLVTREEFEVQRGVLSRTRTRLETLEERVATLEAALETLSAPATATTPAETASTEDHDDANEKGPQVVPSNDPPD